MVLSREEAIKRKPKKCNKWDPYICPNYAQPRY